MKWRLFQRKSNQPSDKMEVLLASTLTPVLPNPEFIQELRIKLVGESEPKVLGLPQTTFQTLLILTSILASSAILIFTGIRTVIAIFGSLGLFQYGKTLKEKPLKMSRLAQ